jgi:hypothetical protein
MAMQSIIRPHGSQLHLTRVVLPSQIVTQSRVEVSIDVKHIALAVLAGFDDGFVGREGFAYSKAGSSVTIPSNDECTIANGGTPSFHLLDSVNFDGTFSPEKQGK